MAVERARDLAAARWLTQSGVPEELLVSAGPGGYEAYARLRLIPDPDRPDQLESEAVAGTGGLSDIGKMRRALLSLATFTSTPESVYFGVWDGYSDVRLPPALSRGPLLKLASREYAVLHGRLEDIGGWERLLGTESDLPPALVWPEDRRWCVVCDVDAHWAGIAATREAVDRLRADDGLDVVVWRPEDVRGLRTYL